MKSTVTVKETLVFKKTRLAKLTGWPSSAAGFDTAQHVPTTFPTTATGSTATASAVTQ